MEIIEVKQKYPKDYFKIDFSIGNICNYQCWYCPPSAHIGNIKWPDIDVVRKNLSFLLDYYIEHTDKKRFEISLLGGEVTHWKEFIPFVKYFKEKYNCLFTLTTNGSKSLEWWETAAPYLSQITISHHQAFCSKEHLRDLADLIYKKNVLVGISVLMDPKCWDDCIESIEYYKKSKYRWSITYIEVLHIDIKYTKQQLDLISNVRARTSNPFYYLRVNKTWRCNTRVIDSNNKTHKVSDNALLHQRLNHFEGWECNVGKDWLAIRSDGTISGICSNKLFDQSKVYNLYDEKFVDVFRPKITNTVCSQGICWCGFEINMNKKKIEPTSKKVIPIHEN